MRLSCEIALDGAYAATYIFHDAPRKESKPFVQHFGRKHGFDKLMLVSGDRESEVKYLADRVGVEVERIYWEARLQWRPANAKARRFPSPSPGVSRLRGVWNHPEG